MILLVVLPILTAVLTLLAWGWPRLQRGLSLLGALATLAASVGVLVTVAQHGIQVLHLGGWQAPIGIVLVADALAATVAVAGAVIAVLVVVLAWARLEDAEPAPAHHALVHLTMLGVYGALLAGDLFNLFVWFEVMLMASFVLLVLDGRRAPLEGGVKYLVLNLISSAAFLIAVGMLFGMVGTLTLADIGRVVEAGGGVAAHAGVLAAAGLLLGAFATKAALFPLSAWLPSSYHTPPTAVTVLFSALLTKVGIIAIIRVFTQALPLGDGALAVALAACAATTMVTGVLGAAVQMELRRILAFHSISQIGYLAVAVALGSAAGLAAAVFFLLHHLLVKPGLFLAAGIAARRTGSDDVRAHGGLGGDLWLLLPTVVLAASLAGMPPLSGFVAKLGIVLAAVHAGAWVAVGLALAVGFFTLYSMGKLVLAWLAPAPASLAARPAGLLPAYAVLVLLALTSLALGLGGGPLYAWCEHVAAQALDVTAYRAAVLP
jgi:multicomponent Na+:H+ antiporter subunit D